MTEPSLQTSTRLGILGGGQLAQMIALAARRQGVSPVVLSAHGDDPAATHASEWVGGRLDDRSALDTLFERSDVVTIENEFLDLEAIGAVHERHPAVRFRPSTSGIAIAQDKLKQKEWFERLGAPTADYQAVHSGSITDDWDRLWARFPDGFVLKWSRFGYDGRGNLAIASRQDVSPERAVEFCRSGEQAGATVYAEQRIEFERELAMVSTRATDGTQRYFPLVVSRQETGVCREVYGPAVEFGISPRLEERSREIMAAMGQDVDFCGTFAVEFFLDPDGKLLVNEMAPRVHNTGHYSLFGQEPSQFDLHVQAVTGAPLSEPRVEGLVVMRNLLGPAGGNRSCSAPTEEPPSGTGLWWYGKGTARPGRKMGHLTGRSDSQEGIEALRDTLRQYESRFWSNTMEKGAQQ